MNRPTHESEINWARTVQDSGAPAWGDRGFTCCCVTSTCKCYMRHIDHEIFDYLYINILPIFAIFHIYKTAFADYFCLIHSLAFSLLYIISVVDDWYDHSFTLNMPFYFKFYQVILSNPFIYCKL